MIHSTPHGRNECTHADWSGSRNLHIHRFAAAPAHTRDRAKSFVTPLRSSQASASIISCTCLWPGTALNVSIVFESGREGRHSHASASSIFAGRSRRVERPPSLKIRSIRAQGQGPPSCFWPAASGRSNSSAHPHEGVRFGFVKHFHQPEVASLFRSGGVNLPGPSHASRVEPPSCASRGERSESDPR